MTFVIVFGGVLLGVFLGLLVCYEFVVLIIHIWSSFCSGLAGFCFVCAGFTCVVCLFTCWGWLECFIWMRFVFVVVLCFGCFALDFGCSFVCCNFGFGLVLDFGFVD